MTSPTPTGRLVRSSATVALGTALSRVTGLARVAVTVAVLGIVGGAPDAYTIANTSPNMIYELLLGGILSATLVPVFVDQFEHGDDEATSAVVTVAVVALVAITVTAVLAAPLIFRLYTFSRDDTERVAEIGVPLTRYFMPQIIFYGLTALGTALLNARKRFAVPAFAPVLNNIVVCTALLALPRIAGEDVSLDLLRDDTVLLALLGLGTTAGIVAMTLVLWPAVHRAGVRLRWRPNWRHPAVRQVASLSGWTLGYVVANQVALVLVAILAGRRDGDWTSYTTAFVFFQLPHGLFAVSLMTTLAPDLASFATRRDMAAYRERFGLGLRLLSLVILPASVGYALLARPLVATLLERGQFGGGATDRTAEVLAAFAVGLLGFSIYLFTVRGFYALKDTRTPFWLNLAENLIHVGLGAALVVPLFAQGLALAYSVAYAVVAVAALAALGRRVGGLELARSGPTLARAVLATALMAAAVIGVSQVVGATSGSGAALRLAAGVVVGMVVYVGAVVALGVTEVTELATRLPWRRSSAPPVGR